LPLPPSGISREARRLIEAAHAPAAAVAENRRAAAAADRVVTLQAAVGAAVEALVRGSGKMLLLHKLLPRLKAKGAKVGAAEEKRGRAGLFE
jgi:hypothetical protein